MAKSGKVYRSAKTGRFVTVNGTYVKKQATEAVKTFFAPLSGAVEATKRAGRPLETVGNDNRKRA